MSDLTHKKRNKSWCDALPFLVSLVLLSACLGPSNAGLERETPKAVISKIIVIPLFYNITLEPLLEKELTRIFKETFYTQGWQIKNKYRDKEKQLTGKITGFSVTPTALSLTGVARAYQMKIQMDVQVVQGSEEGVLLKTKLEGISDYTARRDSAADRAAKNRAIREAAREMAERTAAFLEMPLSKKK